MFFPKKQTKQFDSLFEQLSYENKITNLYNQYVFFINKKLQNPFFFNILAEAPSRWKHWNRKIALVHINKEKRTLFQSFSILQPYPLTMPTWKLALSYLFHLSRKRKTYILFSGNHKMFSLSFLFDEILAKKYNLKFAKAIDYWVPGFVGNRKSMILPVRANIAIPPQFLSSWKFRVKTFSRKFRYHEKNFLHKIETYKYLRESFYPECIILLNSSHLAYNAGQEGYRQKLPIIALASSDSTNYGFSGSHFTLPAAVNYNEHLSYYCFLFLIVTRYGKQQFTIQEHNKFISSCFPNNSLSINSSEKGFPAYKKKYTQFIKLNSLYKNLIKRCDTLIFDTITLPSAIKLTEKTETFGESGIVKEGMKEIIEFVNFPILFDSKCKEDFNIMYKGYPRLVIDLIGQEKFKQERTEDVVKRQHLLIDKMDRKKGCIALFKTLKLFLSCFILQLLFSKTSSFFTEQKRMPFSILKKNYLYNFIEKLVILLMKQQKTLNVSNMEVDWLFYNEMYGKLKNVFDRKKLYSLKKKINLRCGEKDKSSPSAKLEYLDFFGEKKVTFLDRKLMFYTSVLKYKKDLIKKLLFSREKEFSDFVNVATLEKNLISDFVSYSHLKKNLPLTNNLHLGGFIRTFFDLENIVLKPSAILDDNTGKTVNRKKPFFPGKPYKSNKK